MSIMYGSEFLFDVRVRVRFIPPNNHGVIFFSLGLLMSKHYRRF